MAGITLRSSAFNDHTLIPYEHSHEAGDLSPELEWEGVPDGAAELALLCDDPDAPMGSFTHWLVAGIPPDTTGLDPGADLKGLAVGRNDYGGQGYGGPHPPVGDAPHRYFFRLFALTRPSGLSDGFSADEFRRAIDGNTLASGTFVGTYGR
ncbi:YbhB/YbcL family Raf kinase inhibitor-like protein [Nonomuraea terrae]|uniref:YbhB/YbcL family Raf kinase inhibitor-like protein n=1 Tax=Nonomuraea terrae TaxID=2530383 RepID=A0A4R4YNB7_9ACTN|nr:YbhB/YbcL family Raf kinase inhibitor-like protein [Nonomuraea terrae]TDD46040.1 YbhB/YbcL family Raf kinase inhibitor-like protein [Nonomuraea terrae]